MGDGKLLDTTQVINGLAVLFSFFVGYKYALKRHELSNEDKATIKGEGDKAFASALSDNSATSKQRFSLRDNYKMVLVVRNDLQMGKGKIAAQCGHGAVGAYQKAMESCPRLVKAWDETGCAKIALKVESEPEMLALKRAADLNGLVTCVIHDAGRTQIAPNTRTVLAIGPGRVEDIDKITGHLKLL